MEFINSGALTSESPMAPAPLLLAGCRPSMQLLMMRSLSGENKGDGWCGWGQVVWLCTPPISGKYGQIILGISWVVLFMQCWKAKSSITLDVSFTFICRVWPTASIAWFFFSWELMFWFGRYWLWLLENEAVRAEALCQRAELRVQRGHWQERVLGTGIRIVMASCQITVSCVDLCWRASRLEYLTGFPPPDDGTWFVVIIARNGTPQQNHASEIDSQWQRHKGWDTHTTLHTTQNTQPAVDIL